MERIILPSDDPTYILTEDGYNPLREREIESLFTIGNGYLGTRGSLEEQEPVSDPATLIAGVYDRAGAASIEELPVAPDWLYTRIYVDGRLLAMEAEKIVEHRRILDMKSGVLIREWRHRDECGRTTRVKYLRFASLVDPHTLALRIIVNPENYRAEIKVETGVKVCQRCISQVQSIETGVLRGGGVLVKVNTQYTDIKVVEAQKSRVVEEHEAHITPDYYAYSDEAAAIEGRRWQAAIGQPLTIEKYVSIYTSRETVDPEKDAAEHVDILIAGGFDALLSEHISEWERRWRIAAITVEGDADAQRWLNFAAYHLIGADDHRDERVSISARALTGTVYKGHIFWDTEMFILPFFVYTHPACAHAMLMYRYHTLPAARRKAGQMGYKGALFAWESTTTGEEMTPPAVFAPTGEVIPILSGKLEHHINAAVAYGVWSYWNANMDTDFFVAAGAEILIETARFWASRVEKRGEVYHIYNIEGPDEYHEDVNDNIYTNMMAAWNLRRAHDAITYLHEHYPEEWLKLQTKLGFNLAETDLWVDVADNIYKDITHSGNLIEQFDGYFDLQDIDVGDYEPRTAALDVILGREKTAASQVVKQADVVMLLYLMEDEFTEELLRDNFEYYDRRTAHSSSLCPSIYGLVAARLGLMETAVRYFRQAGTIDLANNMGNASGGVHAAALGGLWQQVIMGFAGVRVKKDGIYLYPRLPDSWKRLTFSFLWRKHLLHLDVEPEKHISLTVEGEGEVGIGIYNGPLELMAPGRAYRASWDGVTWQGFDEQKA